jgi:tetratricopeptide (TPR) repeat protein
LIIFILFIGLSDSALPESIKGDEQVFQLEYSVTYKNNSGQTRSVKLEMPVVMTAAPHQKVLKLDVYPKTTGFKSSDKGKYADFLLKQIKPGQTAKCGYKCVIATRRIIHNIDARKTGGKIPDSIRAYCKADARFPAADPGLKNTLYKVTAGESNTYFKALKIYDFVRGFNFQLTNRAVPVLEALSKRTVQCSDAAELLVTLYRAAGIPARYCGGFYLKESENTLRETHAWVEVFFPGEGWVTIDPTMGRFDDITRLSRFCEMDSPYILMWRDKNNPFVVQNADGQGSLSIADFQTSISYKSTKERSGISVNMFYPLLKNLTGVKKSYSPSAANPKALSLYAEADKEFNRGSMNTAETRLRSAIKADPAFFPAYRKLVQIYQNSNRLPDLKSEFERTKDNSKSRGARFYALGVINTLQGNYTNAAADFDMSAAAGAEPFIIDYNRGILYTRCKQLTRAFGYLSSSINSNPAGAPSYRQLIEIMQYLEDDNSIVSLCREAVKIINTGEFYYEMARAYMGLARVEEARIAAEKSVSLNPSEGKYNAILGWVYAEKGDMGKARNYINKALSLGVSGPQKEFLLNLLKRGK